jgi:Pyruvate/2-oxoacid:ferredoxin oxidoreductase delta subunit
MAVTRKIIHIDEEKCDGCGVCIPSCAEGAIALVDGKARLIADKYCDGLGACLGECPAGALSIVEREADEFDIHAVEGRLKEDVQAAPTLESMLHCGCPSSMVRQFSPVPSCKEFNVPESHAGSVSSLSHWPVQIRLVPPKAPFLSGARLLVAADCTPVAYPRFHQDFLAGRAVLMGCPKLDDSHDMVEKFTAIFQEREIKSVTVVIMEVPCCRGLPVMVRKAMEQAGAMIPCEVIVVGMTGTIVD